MSNTTALPSEKSPTGFLPVDLDYLTEELESKAKTELFEDENVRIQSLKLLRSMLETEEDLRWQNDDLFLLAFLRARKFDVKRAFSLIKGFYTSFGKHRDVYSKLLEDSDLRKRIMEDMLFRILPYRDSENCVILLFRCRTWDMKAYSVAEIVAFISFGFIQALRSPSTQVAGFRAITDFTGCTVRRLATNTPTETKLFVDMILNSLPLRIKGFHNVNELPIFASYLWPLVKFFVSKKLSERIHFHGTDLQSLHKYFHPSILPAELGGELPPSFDDDWRERSESSFEYIKHVLSFGYEKYLRKK